VVQGHGRLARPDTGHGGADAGHALTTLGSNIAPLLTAALDPQPARPIGLAAHGQGR
jgi:hypothetical protein